MSRYVDLSAHGFLVEPRYYFFGWTKEKRVLGRDSAVQQLKKAQKLLPNGYRFKIWDMQRPRYVQLNMIDSFKRRFRAANPNLSPSQLNRLVMKFAAKPLRIVPKIDTHRHGGAVDLTIVDKNGLELYMGTDHDDLTERAPTNYFETLKRLSVLDEIARKNRRLLIKVMTQTGWENYSPEWWHWSTTK